MEFVEFIKSPMIDKVKLFRNGSCVDGTLCITGHHLILSSRSTQKEELWVLQNILVFFYSGTRSSKAKMWCFFSFYTKTLTAWKSV